MKEKKRKEKRKKYDCMVNSVYKLSMTGQGEKKEKKYLGKKKSLGAVGGCFLYHINTLCLYSSDIQFYPTKTETLALDMKLCNHKKHAYMFEKSNTTSGRKIVTGK